MLKDLLVAFCTLVLLFALAEAALRILHPEDQLRNNLDLQKTEALKKQPAFYQEHFCDSIHATLKGEQLVASMISESLHDQLTRANKEHEAVWTVGASTTHGFNCNSKTSWPAEVEKLNPGLKIENMALDGTIAEESLERINARLEKHEKPALLLWAHGFTELGFYGDNRDHNWDALQNDPVRMKSIHQSHPTENLVIFVLRLDISLQRYSYAYRYLRALSARLALNGLSGYFKFVAAVSSSRLNPREEYIYSQGPFGGPVRNLVSDSAQAYAVEAYDLNLRKAVARARENRIEFVCVIMPSVPRFYSFLSEDFGRQFDAWIDRVNQRTESVCKELKLDIIDLRAAYRAKMTP